MKNEKKKKGKNVVSESDNGDHILQRRRVMRKGMKEPIEYDLKIPKTEVAWASIYGAGDLLSKGIASLKTENDDAIETDGQPISEEKKFKTAIKSASDEQKKRVAEILGLSIPETEKKMEEIKKEIKKHGFGK